jgi:hypothetical protein
MGIRDIQRKIKLKEEMDKKAMELKASELEAKARNASLTKDRLAEIAKNHGVLLAFDPDMKADVEKLQKQYNVPKGRIISAQMTEEQCLKGKKIDLANLGMLAYQRILLEKEETGGMLTVGEVFDRVNTGILLGRITTQDVEKALTILQKQGIITGIKELDNDVKVVDFFPVQFTNDRNAVLDMAASQGFVTLEDVTMALHWPPERALRALEYLQKIGTARYDESYLTGKKWYFPSLDQQ